MKKIYVILLMITLITGIFTGCSSKKVITIEKFNAIMSELSFFVEDATQSVSSKPSITKFAVVSTEDFKIEFGFDGNRNIYIADEITPDIWRVQDESGNITSVNNTMVTDGIYTFDRIYIRDPKGRFAKNGGGGGASGGSSASNTS